MIDRLCVSVPLWLSLPSLSHVLQGVLKLFAAVRANGGDQGVYTGAVCLILRAVREDYAPIRPDNHIAAKLARVFVRFEAHLHPLADQFGVFTDRVRAVDIANAADAHPICLVDRPPLISEQRDRRGHGEVRPILRQPSALTEKEDNDSHTEGFQFRGLPQLRQMILTGQSLQVTVEHQHECLPAMRRELPLLPGV